MMITRRNVARALLAATTLVAMDTAPRLAFANISARPGRRFVLIILRGAMDGLAAVPPLSDPDYASLRARMALGTPQAPGGALPLDGKFWLHPALAPIHPLYAHGEMIVFHAMASPYRDRSHFDAQNVIESGMVHPGWSRDGWLNRTLVALHATGVQGIAFTPTLPLVLKGDAPSSNWQPENGRVDIEDTVLHMYRTDPVLKAAYQEGLTARGLIEAANRGASQKRGFGDLSAVAGKTLAAEDGPNLAMLEIGGWDTHVGQGTAKGRLAAALASLAEGVEALHQGLGDRWHETVVVAITEFGRTARPNGTGGTDHGTATVGFAFGGAVAGGRVVADWPGLAAGALYQARDLAPTLDVRAVLKAILGDHLGVPSAALDTEIFPDSAMAKPLPGLIRT